MGDAGAASSGCTYYQDVVPGETYSVLSPSYPNNYPSGADCRWDVVELSNSKLILTCSAFNPPKVSECNG